jgi:hypothetical protein
LGLHVADIAPERLAEARALRFTHQDVESGQWGDRDRSIRIT